MKDNQKRHYQKVMITLGAILVTCGAFAAFTHSAPVTAVSVSVIGDANCDGVFDVADVKALQNWLLRRGTLTPEGCANADMNQDGIVNIYDFALMKRALLKQADSEKETNTSPQSDDFIVTSIAFASDSVTLTNEEGAVVSADNATNLSVSDNTYVKITVPGEYSITGFCDNGQIIVDVDKTAYSDGKVELSLSGVTLSNTQSAPVYVASIGKECVISAKKDTVNTISDGTAHSDSYQNSDGETKEINAAIFARDDLKFKGKGTLIVNGNTECGIVSKNDIKIWNSTLTVNAVKTGIKGKDSVRIGDPDETEYDNLIVTVTTQTGDGIKSTDDDETSTDGFVRINGGTVKVHSYSDCIQATKSVEINGGDIDLYSYEGGDYTGTGSSSSGNQGGWGGFGGFGGMNDGNSNKTDDSAKGLKSVGDLTINGGTLNIDTSDDALHCAGTLTVNGGTITISTADDGMHSDNYLIVNGGDIRINKSYEGVEGASITVNDGTIHVVSSDDGFNAAGNKTSLSDYTLVINGGYIFVKNGGDGMDSNGTTTITGGTLLVAGPTGGGDSPLDSEHGITYTGGIVMAVGSSQAMWREDIVGNINGDCWINTNIGTETLLTVTDQNGTVLSAFQIPLNNISIGMVYCNNAVSSDSMQVYAGGTYSGTLNEDGYGEGGSISGGTLLSQDTSSSSQPGGPGNNPGGPGGNR